MIWIRNIGWAALVIATLVIAAAPDLVTLPEPDAAIVLDHAMYVPDSGSGGDVALPHAVYPGTSENPKVVRYLLVFNLPAGSGKDLFLFIPSINRPAALALNGETFFGSESNSIWVGPLVSASIMARLPRLEMSGRNQLSVVVETGSFAPPIYLSRIYLGADAVLAPHYKLRNFLGEQLKILALAAHVLLGLGLIFAYFFRPNDPLFSWLATLNVIGIVVAVGMLVGFHPALQGILPFIVILTPTNGFLLLGVALALLNIPPPRILFILAIATPCVLLPFAMSGTMFARIVSSGSGAVIWTFASVIATGLTTWGAFRQNTDARLMLGPYFLFAWFAIHDIYVTANLPAHPFTLLSPYVRPLFLAFLTAVLMRRMGISLDQFDCANETLSAKLAEREAELAALHRKERIEATRLTREHERQRLTHDLHDGLSGHLVSIIALSERSGEKPTEQAARDALNDLRLVIYSLDLGDRELPLALANFRERLVPQLHRLGVELDWSIAGLPEVSGVTPGNALAVLRILQEAVTNALKHGPARRITIRGAASADGMVAITIQNDGHAFAENKGGHGLANMRRRADQLHGKLDIEALVHGTKLTLLLPSCLPAFEDEAVA